MGNFNTGRGMNLNRVIKQVSVTRLFGIILAVALLAACASNPNQSTGQPGMPSAFANLSKNAQWYLAKVKSADP
ncbi:MAG: penicillin-binding protein activator, partial [Aeromonas sp.]